jgi:hypothetical protein
LVCYSFCSSIFEGVGEDSFFIAILVFALLLVSVCEYEEASAISVVLDIRPNVGVATCILVSPLAVLLVVSVLSVVEFSICVLVHALPVLLIIFPLAVVDIAVR